MNEPDDLVQMVQAHLELKYRPLPEGWKPFHVDTPSGDKGFVVCLGKLVRKGDLEVLEFPEIRGEGSTLKEATREAVRQVRNFV